jgi:hypothetical protein
MRAPKLLVHGRYDEFTPLETELEPFYSLLPEPKDKALFDGGHRPDPAFLFLVVNKFLDENLGRVRLRPDTNAPETGHSTFQDDATAPRSDQ